MKHILFLLITFLILISCTQPRSRDIQLETASKIQGTWKLLSGTIIKGVDTVTTDYTKGQEMIKIINATHFSFLRHDLLKGKDSSAVFVAGGGRYTIDEKSYTEYLEYCNYREWEGNIFEFNVLIKNDTLISTGIEKIEALGVDQLNIEVFVRLK